MLSLIQILLLINTTKLIILFHFKLGRNGVISVGIVDPLAFLVPFQTQNYSREKQIRVLNGHTLAGFFIGTLRLATMASGHPPLKSTTQNQVCFLRSDLILLT